jgi:hypothetical protein
MQKLEDFITSRTSAQEMLSNVLMQEENNARQKYGSIQGGKEH